MGGLDVEEMLRTIETECRYTKGITGVATIRPQVLEAMGRVPRDQFVPNFYKSMAYENMPLPIGHGQTISQPFIVAPPLKQQLKNGGRLVIPIGHPAMTQQLMVLEKDKRGKFTSRDVLSVAFVPLTGGGGTPQTDDELAEPY